MKPRTRSSLSCGWFSPLGQPGFGRTSTLASNVCPFVTETPLMPFDHSRVSSTSNVLPVQQSAGRYARWNPGFCTYK
jgi:hypothetical protein